MPKRRHRPKRHSPLLLGRLILVPGHRLLGQRTRPLRRIRLNLVSTKQNQRGEYTKMTREISSLGKRIMGHWLRHKLLRMRSRQRMPPKAAAPAHPRSRLLKGRIPTQIKRRKRRLRSRRAKPPRSLPRLRCKRPPKGVCARGDGVILEGGGEGGRGGRVGEGAKGEGHRGRALGRLVLREGGLLWL